MNIQDFDVSVIVLIVLVAVSIKATLLAGLVWLSAAVCRVRSSTTRHQLAKFVLWSMMLMPALMFVVPSIPVPESVSIQHVMPRDEVLPSVSVEPIARSMSPTNAAATAKVELNAAIEPAIASTPDPSTKTETKADPQQSRTLSRSWSWTQVLVCLWLSVTAALLIRVFAGWLKCRKILANVSAVELPVSIPCDYPVVTSSQLTVPATLGIINPKIVLPGDWCTWSEADLEMAVAHEASHIERNDSLTTLLSAINCAIHWFNPVSWILKWRLAVLAEHICDDAVIRKVGTRHEYAHCLVRMASRLSESPTQVSLGVGMARTALVEERVTMILDAGRGLSKRRGAIASLFTFVVIAFVAATTAAVGGFADSEDEQPVPEDSIAGIVLMPDGSPAAEVDVFMSTWMPPSHRAQTKTDRKGRFVFTDFPDGVHRVIARSESLSSLVRWGGNVADRGVSNLQIQLGETSTLKVKVVDAKTAEPIPDAVVEISKWFPDWQQKVDDSGVATYAKLPREKWEVIVKAKGYTLKTQEVVVEEANTEFTVSLSNPGADLFGKVTDEEGNPVPRANIYFASAEERVDLRSFHDWARTDKDGNYRFSGLPTNKKLVTRVVAAEIKDVEKPLMLTVERGGEQRHDIRATRLPETTVEGTIVDIDDTPISGARVSIIYDNRKFDCETDEQGDYKLVGRFGSSQLAVEAHGFVRQRTSLDLSQRIHVFNTKLKHGNTCLGKVVDKHGNPIAGVDIQATIYEDFVASYEKVGMTDSEGRFEINSLPEDCRMRFFKEGFAVKSNLQAVRELEPVVLLPEGVIRGKVIDAASGKAVTNFRARYTWSTVRFPDDPPQGGMSMAANGGELFANKSGLFEFKGFRQAVPVEVTVEAEGYKRCTIKRIVALENSNTETATFNLKPAGVTPTVAGEIVDSKGKGIPGVNVCLICSDERGERSDRIRNDYPYNWEMIFARQIIEDSRVDRYLEATTDADGRFEFSKVQDSRDIEVVWWGDNVVRGRKPGIASLNDKQQRSLMIHATQSGTVLGSINVKANRYASPSIQIKGETYESQIIDDGKTFQFKGLPPGRYEVLIHGNPQPLKIPGREDDGAFTTRVIKRIPVHVKAGEITRADAAGERL